MNVTTFIGISILCKKDWKSIPKSVDFLQGTR